MRLEKDFSPLSQRHKNKQLFIKTDSNHIVILVTRKQKVVRINQCKSADLGVSVIASSLR